MVRLRFRVVSNFCADRASPRWKRLRLDYRWHSPFNVVCGFILTLERRPLAQVSDRNKFRTNWEEILVISGMINHTGVS